MKKTIIAIIAVAIVAALVFAYIQMSKERAAEAEREKPVASESKVSRNANGESVLTMDEAAQQRLALKIEALAAAQLEPEVKGYGRVLDPATLSSSVAEFVSARAAADASQKELVRLKTLAEQDNASGRALQTAEAAAKRDDAQAEAARTRLLTTWGKAIADRVDLTTFVQSLALGDSELVRIDLLAGELLKSPPLSARLFALSDENNVVAADFVGPAPAVDALTQGQGFLFLVPARQPGFTPGASVVGFLKIAGEARNGVTIPRGAVVRFGGKPWIYLQTGGDTFLRREISLDTPLAGGWFGVQGVKPDDRVVVGGAQMLLSEEQKYQIRMGD